MLYICGHNTHLLHTWYGPQYHICTWSSLISSLCVRERAYTTRTSSIIAAATTTTQYHRPPPYQRLGYERHVSWEHFHYSFFPVFLFSLFSENNNNNLLPVCAHTHTHGVPGRTGVAKVIPIGSNSTKFGGHSIPISSFIVEAMLGGIFSLFLTRYYCIMGLGMCEAEWVCGRTYGRWMAFSASSIVYLKTPTESIQILSLWYSRIYCPDVVEHIRFSQR